MSEPSEAARRLAKVSYASPYSKIGAQRRLKLAQEIDAALKQRERETWEKAAKIMDARALMHTKAQKTMSDDDPNFPECIAAMCEAVQGAKEIRAEAEKLK